MLPGASLFPNHILICFHWPLKGAKSDIVKMNLFKTCKDKYMSLKNDYASSCVALCCSTVVVFLELSKTKRRRSDPVL